MINDLSQPISSTGPPHVPSSHSTSKSDRRPLTTDKVDGPDAIVKASLENASPETHDSSNTKRARRLLGGSTIAELFARAKELWAADVLDPFSFYTSKISLGQRVPRNSKRSIDIGMNKSDSNPTLPAVREDGDPAHDFAEVAGAHDVLADLPPESEEAVRYYADLQRRGGSFKIWTTWWRLLAAYCLRWQRKLLPMAVSTAIGVLTHMARAGYAYSTLRNVRWTLSKAHQLAGFSDPTRHPLFRLYFKLIAKDLGTEPIRRKAAILFHLLRRIGELAWKKGTLRALQEWTGIDLEYFSTLRRQNVVDLNIEDLRRGPSWYDAHVRRGKNHQTKPRDIQVKPIPNDPLLCPVATLDRWLETLRKAGITHGPLLRHFGRGGVLTEKRLSARTLTRIIKRYAKALGLPPEQYASQSLRRGNITQSLVNGVDQADLRDLTGHECVESLDPYYDPGELAPNLSMAATYGVIEEPDAIDVDMLPAALREAQDVTP